MRVVVTDGVVCPAGHTEIEPGTEHLPFYDPMNPEAPHKRFQIRAYKVGDENGVWWSECCVCRRWFADGRWEG